MFVSITGPSGSGKTTLARNLLKALPGSQSLTSYTTRERRESDLPQEYTYISKEGFSKLEGSGAFLWTTSPHSEVRYGTTNADIYSALTGNELYVGILVPAVLPVLKDYAEQLNRLSAILFMYLSDISTEELEMRLKHRGDAPEDIERRLRDKVMWNAQARDMDIAFTHLNASQTSEEIASDAIEIITRA